MSFIYTVANVAVKRGVPVVCKKYDSLIFGVCKKLFPFERGVDMLQKEICLLSPLTLK